MAYQERLEGLGMATNWTPYLLKYSSDLNPIKMPFSKLKAGLRKAAEQTVRACTAGLAASQRPSRLAKHPTLPGT